MVQGRPWKKGQERKNRGTPAGCGGAKRGDKKMGQERVWRGREGMETFGALSSSLVPSEVVGGWEGVGRQRKQLLLLLPSFTIPPSSLCREVGGGEGATGHNHQARCRTKEGRLRRGGFDNGVTRLIPLTMAARVPPWALAITPSCLSYFANGRRRGMVPSSSPRGEKEEEMPHSRLVPTSLFSSP